MAEMAGKRMKNNVLGPILLLAACSGAEDAGAPTWQLVEERRIGSVDGAGPGTFSEITDLELDPLGRIYVLDRQAQEIRVFEPSGTHVRTIGRPGGGPGEFRLAYGIALDSTGHLWVVDARAGRYSVFDTNGTFVTSHRRETTCYGWLWPGRMLPDGSVLDYTCVLGELPENSEPVFVRWDSVTRYRDTLPIPPSRIEPRSYDFRDANRTGVMMAVPFAPGRRALADPRGHLWVGDSDEYRIYEVGPGGDTLRVIEGTAPPVPVTAAERDSALAPVREQAGNRPVDPGLVPQTKPVFQGFATDDAGRLWVRRPLPHGELGTVFDVFDTDGRLRATVRAPFSLHRYPPPVIRDGRLYGVVRDEFDVPYVILARLEGSPE